MTDRDTITLPRKHIDYAAHALEHLIKNYNGSESFEVLVSEIIHHLRTHLAAEQPKQEPGLMEGLTELARQMKPLDADMAAILHDNLDSLYIEDEPTLAAEQPKPSEDAEALRRDAEQGRWLREWLDNNGLLIRAIRGESLAGYEHPDIEALRRDAERYRWLREKDGIAVDVTVFGSMEANLDAAIDAAMGDKT